MRSLYESIKEDKSEADKMFEELGYKKDLHINDVGNVWGEYFTYDNSLYKINFDYIDKEFCCFCVSDDAPMYVTMQELQAINKKCKELGWLDE